jgi:hypothetical protein
MRSKSKSVDPWSRCWRSASVSPCSAALAWALSSTEPIASARDVWPRCTGRISSVPSAMSQTKRSSARRALMSHARKTRSRRPLTPTRRRRRCTTPTRGDGRACPCRCRKGGPTWPPPRRARDRSDRCLVLGARRTTPPGWSAIATRPCPGGRRSPDRSIAGGRDERRSRMALAWVPDTIPATGRTPHGPPLAGDPSSSPSPANTGRRAIRSAECARPTPGDGPGAGWLARRAWSVRPVPPMRSLRRLLSGPFDPPPVSWSTATISAERCTDGMSERPPGC